MFATRSGAAKLSIAVVSGLIALKVWVGAVTGSISVIAQAADSLLDLFAIAITFFAVVIAVRPADERHPFGHGKAEYIAAAIQAMLIFIAGGLVIYSAVRRMIAGATLEMTEAGMGVMLVSVIASIFLSRHLLKVARVTDSMALESNARNITADIYSSAGVLVGLTVIRFTGLNILDPIIALLISLIIFKTAYEVLKKSFGGLMDVSLPEAEENVVRAAITEHTGEVVSFHNLQTRKAGSRRYINLHLVMPKDISLEEAHRMCDHLEQDIKSKLPNASVTIHVEPPGG